MNNVKTKRVLVFFMVCFLLIGSIWKGGAPVHAEEKNISAMFDSSDNNTWLFAGGVETQGRYEEVKGRRNYVGDIEESIRKGASGGAPEHQRYTINVGSAGRDLAGFLEKMDDYIKRLDPKAVSYLIGEEDFDKGEEGLDEFQENLSILIEKSLSMKEGGGYAVIQLPHAVNGERNANAELYAEAAKETAETFSEEQGRIRIVDHYTKTNTSGFLNGGKLTESGRLNGDGHFVIAEQFCREVAGAWKNTSPVTKNWEETESPELYLAQQPEVLSSADSLTVLLPEEFGQTQGIIWHLKIDDMEIEGTAEDALFTISDLPQGKDYKLTVYSGDGRVSLTSVYGKILRGAKGGGRTLNNVQQKIVEKASGEDPLTWVFLGDSITHGLVHTKGYDSTAQTFEKYLKEDLQREDDVVINTGVSSTETVWVLENLYQRAEKYKPDVVFIMLGTNDVYSNVNQFHVVDGTGIVITKEWYCRNMKEIVRRLRIANPDVSIVVRAPSPVNRESRNIYLDQGGYLDALEEMIREDGDILYVDQYREWDKELRTFPYMWNANYYFSDSTLHPGAAGQLKMTQMVIDACGLNTDTRFANLAYKLHYDKEESAVKPSFIIGDHKIKVEKSSLSQAYKDAGGSGAIGHIEICLTDENGKTYTQRTSADGTDFVMKDIPYGVYNAEVTGTRTDAAVYTAFAAQTVELSENVPQDFTVCLDREIINSMEAGDTAGVVSVGEMAPDGRYTYTLCDGDGSDDNEYFQIKGRTLKIKTKLEANREYKIRIKAENAAIQKETALILRTAQTLNHVRTEAQEAFSKDRTALDIDAGGFTFDGNNYIDLADQNGNYYADGAYLEVLNNLKENSTGGSIIFRFRTQQNQALIFGAGSTAADDGKNMIFGLDNLGKFRGHYRLASGSGLKGSMGTSLSVGEWHTVAMSFDMTKEDFLNQVITCIDGGANCYPQSWWTAAYRTWFSANNAEITKFSIGGGDYALQNTFGAFSGNVDFVTITDKVYSEDELRTISGSGEAVSAPREIKETGTFLVSGTEITASGQTGFSIERCIWNNDNSAAEIYLTAQAGYVFAENISAAQPADSGFEASIFWETAQNAVVELKKVSKAEEPDPKPEPEPEPEPKAEQKRLAAPEIISVEMTAEKKRAGVKIVVSKVEGGEYYSVYRVSGGKTVYIGRADAGGAVYDENPADKKEAFYYAVAESQNPAYTKSENGQSKGISLSSSVKKVTAKQQGKKAQVQVSWKKVKGAKAYLVYRSEKKDTGFVRLTNAKGVKKTAFTDKKVKKGKVYYYKVLIKTKKGYSAPKVSKKIKVKK